MRKEKNRGTIYIVSTPIGNLEDITLRALRILKEVDIIAAEDTRRTRKLLSHYEISKHLISYHDHNKIKQAEVILKRLEEGHNVALVSDAGTPGISDPSYHLINLALKHNFHIESIPGPSAVIAALSISGLPIDKFAFEGFLPRKKGKRQSRIEQLKNEERTIILYESPYRIHRLLDEILSIIGNRQIVLAREITKKFEEIIRGELKDIIEQMKDKKIKGEITLILMGSKK